ncbi:hypothetical protein HMPREF9477_00478 [Lachnospiraceae bacterium 2_1_46FAA]|nr:hypothetical protein HMPREF9477_00478 [Lachnospiraceae bacterium 2_1_46FAA]
MYQIIKVLNNNAFLAKHDEGERILVGKGIGFGKKPGDTFTAIKDAKIYTLAVRENERSVINAVKGIEPKYLEAAGRVIDEAQVVFKTINPDILIPLADHIAFAAKRAEENIYLPNPFIADIKALFGKEYTVVVKSREIIEEMTGYRITDDEAGFIALHVHSGLSDAEVSETLKITQIIDECMLDIEKMLDQHISRESLGGIRLMSHLYYMIARSKAKEKINIDLNQFVEENYAKAGMIARHICREVERKLEVPVIREEEGFLAVHIQTIIIP